MAIWTIADLHLAFGCPDKNMGLINPIWKGYEEKIASAWKKDIKENDLVLIPGDISWAMKLNEAEKDLLWIANLPGTKLLLKGNHDYWWSSLSRVREALPPTVHVLQNDFFLWKGIAIGGSRLWDTPEYTFNQYVERIDNPKEKPKTQNIGEDEKIFERELLRLEMSLKQLPKESKERIAMTHYPPIGADLAPSRTSKIFEKYGINTAVFGHLHNLFVKNLFSNKEGGIRYILASADYLDFTPRQLY